MSEFILYFVGSCNDYGDEASVVVRLTFSSGDCNVMKCYSIYGLTIQSEFELPELPTVEAEPSDVDVIITQESVKSFPERPEEHTDFEVHRIGIKQAGWFSIEEGKRIRCDPESPSTAETKIFRRLLQHEALGRLLVQRGVLVLHASAVSIDGHGAVFLGESTAGKSTTAAAFFANGYRVIADDLVGIQFENGRPVILPSVPQLRIGPEAVEQLGITETKRYPDDMGPEKHYRPVEPLSDPVPLSGCYVLGTNDTVNLRELTGPERFFHIHEASFLRGFLSDDDVTPYDFENLSRVAENTPIWKLDRPKKFERLPDVVDVVSQSLLPTTH